jgi:hypothetical protein
MVALLALFSVQIPIRAYTVEYRDSAGIVAGRWLTKPIIVSFSTSLYSPPSNIKAGSDVIGALHNALAHWTKAGDVQFLETSSTAQTISPHNAGDRINLITVSAENAGAFRSSESPGRTRVFYDSGGAIVEADIALNPNQPFSTDGTPGTYDLESTFTHEVGHLLGLEHSPIIGATMQPRQAMNGVYGLPAFTQRSLSADDIAGVRALYGSRAGTGAITGKLIANASSGESRPVFGAQIFAEDAESGKVVASTVSLASGEYHIDTLAPGNYHVVVQSLNGPISVSDISSTGGQFSNLTEPTEFRSFMAANGPALSPLISISSDAPVSLGSFVFTNPALTLKPQVIGMNGELSTTPLPLKAGKTFRIYVGGEGIDQIPAAGISISSPLITVSAGSLQPEEFDTPYPVISFEVTVPANVQTGDYSIRLQSGGGEFSYLAGAITIE